MCMLSFVDDLYLVHGCEMMNRVTPFLLYCIYHWDIISTSIFLEIWLHALIITHEKYNSHSCWNLSVFVISLGRYLKFEPAKRGLFGLVCFSHISLFSLIGQPPFEPFSIPYAPCKLQAVVSPLITIKISKKTLIFSYLQIWKLTLFIILQTCPKGLVIQNVLHRTLN